MVPTKVLSLERHRIDKKVKTFCLRNQQEHLRFRATLRELTADEKKWIESVERKIGQGFLRDG